MKRAVKKNISLENSGTKTLKPASAKISKQEKPAALQKKTVVAAEKPVKKLKTTAAAKISVPAPKAKKAVSVKPFKQENTVAVKKKTSVGAEKITKKSKPVTATEKVIGKLKPVAAAKAVVAPPKTKKSVAVNETAKLKKEKIIAPVSVKNLKLEKEKVFPKTLSKKVKTSGKKTEIVIPALKAKPENKAKATPKKVEKVEKKAEKKIEIVAQPSVPKPVKKKIKPIGSAVVRGKTGRYDFEVFPLDAELKDGSAIYVISKRVTDKGGRGHHKFVCIGQTESLLGEIKKHKKDKCIKQHNANVICLLREESETNRVKIETDLREAHTIFCNQK